jgi:LPXTG-site transpeptidase (sortase) family protein
MHTPPPPRSNTIRRVRGLVTVFLVAALAGLGATVARTADASDHNLHMAHGVLPRTASGGSRLADRRVRAAIDGITSTTTSTTRPAPVAAASVEDTTLLSPEDVPDPGATRPIQIIGRIQIPKIGLDVELRDQITQESIDLGPSHWPGTAGPGGFGNAVIAGHRNSHSAPFHDAGNLHAGDTITLVAADGARFNYTITETFVVDPSAMWITEQKPGHTLTLFTCHPLGSSSQRLVVRATLA